MRNRSDEGPELLDQPRRQTMSFRSMPAALEADPERRSMRLVFVVNEPDPARENSRWHVDSQGCLIGDQPQVRRVAGSRYFRRAIGVAARISDAVEEAFTGLKFTSDWSRWLIHRADGVKIARPTYIEERGTLELVICVDPDANYDRVYRFIIDVLERQPGYEARAFRPPVFTREEEIAIELMPKGDQDRGIPSREKRATPPLPDSPPKELWRSAADILRGLFERRRELSR
jgi:hypothetical protein